MAQNPRTSITDTPLYRMTNGIYRWFAVSMLWLLCSLPLVTMGAATVAALKEFSAPENSGPHKLAGDYFRCFRKCLPRATALWLLTLALAGLLALDAAFYRQMLPGASWLLPGAAVILGNLLLGLARFGCFVIAVGKPGGFRDLLKQAAKTMVLCLPVWAVMVALDLVVVTTLTRIPYLCVSLVILPGLYANMHCRLIQSFLRRYEAEES